MIWLKKQPIDFDPQASCNERMDLREAPLLYPEHRLSSLKLWVADIVHARKQQGKKIRKP